MPRAPESPRRRRMNLIDIRFQITAYFLVKIACTRPAMFRVGVMVRKRGISERKDGRIYRVIGSSYALGEREAIRRSSIEWW
jgi:hypothetical protein